MTHHRDDTPPEPAELTADELHVVQSLHRARMTERAPQSLRERIEASRPSPAARARSRLGYGLGFAGALAAVVLSLVLILPGGTPGAPSLSQAAALAGLGPDRPAPASDQDHPGSRLGQSVGDAYFPDWSVHPGWRAIGQRTDRIGDRRAVTVYYSAGHGRLVAYTIVDAPALATPPSDTRVLNGTTIHTLKLHNAVFVTWQRDGHTCLLTAARVPPSVLREVAAWNA
jgi:hypothetical protein